MNAVNEYLSLTGLIREDSVQSLFPRRWEHLYSFSEFWSASALPHKPSLCGTNMGVVSPDHVMTHGDNSGKGLIVRHELSKKGKEGKTPWAGA